MKTIQDSCAALDNNTTRLILLLREKEDYLLQNLSEEFFDMVYLVKLDGVRRFHFLDKILNGVYVIPRSMSEIGKRVEDPEGLMTMYASREQVIRFAQELNDLISKTWEYVDGLNKQAMEAMVLISDAQPVS